ncbi:SLC13 family permease [Desulfobulbus rhabdoformis]|uniref:SLC13 family permease n=1 Tax=Desulfobulbus rhabdoformis TaxID=34032 RepID=UPI001963339B|nr:SLC13 family permease [Desulfobulbus rhabdoformis]MBM9614243.1 SLC13 family permease [Desulfobulbus rhabdoformis]
MHFPLPPNPHAIAVLLLTILALVLLSREKIALETSSLFLLVSLSVGFELFPFADQEGTQVHAVDFFSGFGHEALVAVCALMVAGQGVMRTNALEPAGRILARLWKRSPSLSLLLTLCFGAAISAFINNVPVVVLLMPVLISVSCKTGTSAASVLMPMGFSTLLGGTATTIGTSTNLLIVSVASDMGLKRMNMFDFILPAALAASVGLLYLWLVAPRLLPRRGIAIDNGSPRVFDAHLAVLEKSKIVHLPLAKAIELTGGSMRVLALERGHGNLIMPLPDVELRAGDHLVLKETPEKLKEFEQILEGTLYPVDSAERPIDNENPLQAPDQQIAELVILQSSPLHGQSLSESHFAEQYGLVTLAIHRTGRSPKRIYDRLEKLPLMVGDILLVQGPRRQIAKLKERAEMLVLDSTMDLPFSQKAPVAMFIMKGIILTAAFGLLPIAVSATLGALLMILTGCLNWRDASRALSVQVILIVVASLALGTAMLRTGAAEYLATLFLTLAGNASPALVLSGLMLLMALFTNIISNNATAVIGTPIAVSIAEQLQLPAEAFVLAVLFGANMSYATPMAYKTNLLIMNAGEYNFHDFLRVGVPLLLLMWALLSLVLPILYL